MKLSVVATSRNDDHGGGLLCRMQHFIDGLRAQCSRHAVAGELVLVEWNPPRDRPPLAEALRWHAATPEWQVRIITVPAEVHARFANADKVRLFQMIAKNVGVRRTRGEFVLATNVDVLLSDAAMRFIGALETAGALYLADRIDVPANMPADPDFAVVARFCEANGYRVHAAGATLSLHGKRTALWQTIGRFLGAAKAHANRRPWMPQTNACGDFTLMARSDWHRLRGYPEWAVFSWHLDSILVYQAIANGISLRRLPRAAPVFHIDHGEGFTPEAAAGLFSRLRASEIPFLTESDRLRIYDELTAASRKAAPSPFNGDAWGLADVPLAETRPS